MNAYSTWLLTNIIATLLLPPFDLLILGTLGLVFLKRRPRLGKSLLGFSLLALYLLSTPWLANQLMGFLEKDIAPISVDEALKAHAIIVLGAGVYSEAPEYARDVPDPLSLERLEYAAFLHRQTGLPILVTGGNPEGGKPVANAMLRTLQDEFNVPVKWVENKSMDTRQNAQFSAELLAPLGIKRVLVVSDAWHLPRAQIAFARAGLDMIPAPTRFGHRLQPEPGYAIFGFLPQARGLVKSSFALHEFMGLLWYRLRY